MMTNATARYVNAYHSTHSLDPAVYATTAKPTTYRGYTVYRRLDCCFDVVRDGVCIGQYAGMGGAKLLIDAILDTPTDFWAERAMDALARGLKVVGRAA